jgi:tripeptide aminopeptidase
MNHTNPISAIADHPRVRAALAAFAANLETAVARIIAIQQIPSPTFAEARRAAYVEEQFAALGLRDVGQDDLHNVYGRLPGGDPTARPVIISAHSDTVFPAATDLSVRRDGQILHGPGIGDNAAGVAGLLLLAEALRAHDLTTPADLWFVCNVGEEGLGDLRGMRAVVERFGQAASYIVLEGGLYGQIAHQAIGVRRFRVDIKAAGGHSWGNFGAASAVHEAARLIAALDGLSVPASPKTTYNVGVVSGGSSVNTIAQEAMFLLDLRSEATAELERLVRQVESLVAEAGKSARDNGREVAFTLTQVGARPAGAIGRSAPLVKWAEAALRTVGSSQITYIAGSTDANIPLSQGIPAVCVGLTVAGNAHRLDEYIELQHLPRGLGHVLLLALTAGGFRG